MLAHFFFHFVFHSFLLVVSFKNLITFQSKMNVRRPRKRIIKNQIQNNRKSWHVTSFWAGIRFQSICSLHFFIFHTFFSRYRSLTLSLSLILSHCLNPLQKCWLIFSVVFSNFFSVSSISLNTNHLQLWIFNLNRKNIFNFVVKQWDKSERGRERERKNYTS